MLEPLDHDCVIPLRRRIAFPQNRPFRLRNSISRRHGPFCCCNFCPLSFVRRHGTSAMVPSPLCGRIVTFEIYPRKNQGKNVRGRPGGTRSRSKIARGRPKLPMRPLGVPRAPSGCSLGASWVPLGRLLGAQRLSSVRLSADNGVSPGSLEPSGRLLGVPCVPPPPPTH